MSPAELERFHYSISQRTASEVDELIALRMEEIAGLLTDLNIMMPCIIFFDSVYSVFAMMISNRFSSRGRFLKKVG